MNASALIAADGSAGIGIAILVVFIVVVVVYQSMLKKGIRARVLVSNLSADQLRAIFASKVATFGWKVIDNDNPTVAQSPLLSGRRQQISLTMTRESNGIRCHIAPSRVWVKFGGVPYKAHTLRMRLNAFERAVVNNGGASVSASGSAARTNSASVAPVEASQPTLTGPPAAVLPPAILVAPFRPPLSTQAGQWVSDPFKRHQLRYHDGKEWTPNVSDAGVVGIDPPEWRQASQVQQMTPLAAPPSDTHDGKTMSRSDLAAVKAPSVSIRLDNGAIHRVSGRTLLGRNPAPHASEPAAQCLAIEDTSMTVSKTHLLVLAVNGEVTVQDRSSANGTTVEFRDGSRLDAIAGQMVVVPVGSIVRFGDRSFTIERS